MSELVGCVLRNLYEQKGDSLLKDPQILQELLLDLCPDETRAIRLILLGLSRQVPRQLLQEYSSKGVTLAQELSRDLEQTFGIDRRFTDWIVKTWAAAQSLVALSLEPHNIFADAEAEYRQALHIASATGPLTEHLKNQLDHMRKCLLIDTSGAKQILIEVQAEIRRQESVKETVQSPNIRMAPLENKLGMQFIRIEPGAFQMGSSEYERQREMDEDLHQVKLTQPFYLQTTPVTQTQWQEVMGTNPSDFKGADLPVENISWNDIVTQFLPRINAKGQGNYRLPTEAEWEYAARAGCTQTYYLRDEPSLLDSYAWYSNNAQFKTHPVAQKKANAWGFFDLHGNIWEWCKDWYGSYELEPQTDPQGPHLGMGRVMRGGCWFSNSPDCRLSARGYMPPETRIRLIGFRLVKEEETALNA